MKKILRTGLVVLGIVLISLSLLNCDFFASAMLEGTWIRQDDKYRSTFVSDGGTFTEESWNGSSWEIVSNGDYTYNTATQDLVLDDQMNGWTVVQDIIMNTAADRMALGTHALTGGDTATLIGTWTGGNTIDSTTIIEDEWVFTATTISHTNVAGNANGTVSINTAATEFTVSGSSDIGILENGIYKYIVIGEGVTISEAGDPSVDCYYDKQ